MTDAFGVTGREWLAGQPLPADERDTIDAALRQIDFLTGEITTIERDLAAFVLASPDARRLLTVPGVGMITAGVFLAQVGTARGDINRFTSPNRLVGYLGLDPRVRQSGNGPGHTGRISKQGAAAVRHVLVESALTAIRSPGPLRAFYQRIRARRGHQIAIVASARKMAKLFWHLLVREQDYAYTLPTALAKKIRTIELKAGHERRRPGGNRTPLNREQRRAIERQIAQHAQTPYERSITDWKRAVQPEAHRPGLDVMKGPVGAGGPGVSLGQVVGPRSVRPCGWAARPDIREEDRPWITVRVGSALTCIAGARS
jgi:hypothetical protein